MGFPPPGRDRAGGCWFWGFSCCHSLRGSGWAGSCPGAGAGVGVWGSADVRGDARAAGWACVPRCHPLLPGTRSPPWTSPGSALTFLPAFPWRRGGCCGNLPSSSSFAILFLAAGGRGRASAGPTQPPDLGTPSGGAGGALGWGRTPACV